MESVVKYNKLVNASEPSESTKSLDLPHAPKLNIIQKYIQRKSAAESQYKEMVAYTKTSSDHENELTSTKPSFVRAVDMKSAAKKSRNFARKSFRKLSRCSFRATNKGNNDIDLQPLCKHVDKHNKQSTTAETFTDKLRHVCCCFSPKPTKTTTRERRENAMRRWEQIAERSHAKERTSSDSSAANDCEQYELCSVQTHPSERNSDALVTGETLSSETDKDSTLSSAMFLSIPVFCHGNKYGITMIDSCPAQISQLTPGSAAEEAGLKIGDVIVGINGQSVRYLDSVTVGRIIRHFPKCIVVDVVRLA